MCVLAVIYHVFGMGKLGVLEVKLYLTPLSP